MKSVCSVCTMLYANVHTFMRLIVVIGIEDVSSLLSSVIFFVVEFFFFDSLSLSLTHSHTVCNSAFAADFEFVLLFLNLKAITINYYVALLT